MNCPPVLFLIFNRPVLTQRVFACIRAARPSQLFVAADGPRSDRSGEAELCKQTRSIIGAVDWDCEILTLFREKNLGCRTAVSSAIDWFFEQVEEGIVLEDDCLPSQSFFQYCQELIEYYRYDTRIMQICGFNALKQWRRCGHSYYFSTYGPVWGWASWRRAWRYYDVDMKLWPEIKRNNLYVDFCQNKEEARHRFRIYEDIYTGKIDTWDYQWGFTKMINHGLSITPAVNLISNIGFAEDATHTSGNDNDPYANLETGAMTFPLQHPPCIIRDCLADQRYLNEFMSVTSENTYAARVPNFSAEIKK